MADLGFWLTVIYCVYDLIRGVDIRAMGAELLLWIVLIRLNGLESKLEPQKRRYVAPHLRKLQWDQLTPLQQDFARVERARHRFPSKDS